MDATVRECWRPVVGYEGLYEVSDQGQVRRSGGRTPGARLGRILRTSLSPRGYVRVHLCHRYNDRSVGVHQLVAAAFLGRCPNGTEINHKDGNKANNTPLNLEYVTHSENMRHAFANSLHHAVIANAKLTSAQVGEIRQLYRPGIYGIQRLGRRFGVDKSTIAAIVRYKTWKDVAAS